MIRHLEQELEDLKNRLLAMSTLALSQLDIALAGLRQGDPEVAERIRPGEERINLLDSEIERQCQEIFALTQPVAIDLRLLMAALNINHELERMGDIAVNVAERSASVAAHGDLVKECRLLEMADIARIMAGDSIESLELSKPDLATRVLESDDVVDDLEKAIFRSLVSAMRRDESLIEPAAHCIVTARHLERLADHATNIAEDVIFLLKARIIKHNAGHDPA